MNTKLLLFICVGVCTGFINRTYAQSTYELGVLPALNLNSKLNNDWSLNTRIESRQVVQSGRFNEKAKNHYNYILTDFSLIAAKKVGLNSRLAGGYLLRLEEGELVHRLVQQYILLQRLSGLRIAHRLMSDQTFSKAEKSEFRLRYRFTSELPLSGQSVDPGEMYLKFSNEYVNGWQELKYDLELRLIPLLGYNLSGSTKIETGPDYRVGNFINADAEHRFWMSLNLFIDI